MKTLHLVRHGLSQANVSGHYAGQTDTPLTAIGKKQASSAGKLARDNGLVFDIILASPLQRAYQTAQYIATELGYNHENIILEDKLKERNFGSIEGVHYSKVPISREQYISNPFALDEIENIEKITDLQYRANKILRIVKSMPQDNVLLVCHGSIGRAIERAAKNLPLSDFGTSLSNAQMIRLI